MAGKAVTTNASSSIGNESDSLIKDTIGTSASTVETNSNRITADAMFQPAIEYPFLALLASGGHTSLMVCHDMGNYTVLGKLTLLFVSISSLSLVV